MGKIKANTTAIIMIVLLSIASSCTQSKELVAMELANDSFSTTVTRIPCDVEGIDYIVTFDQNTANQDYVVETLSSIPLTDTYAVERGVDRGLVFLVFESMRQVSSFARVVLLTDARSASCA